MAELLKTYRDWRAKAGEIPLQIRDVEDGSAPASVDLRRLSQHVALEPSALFGIGNGDLGLFVTIVPDRASGCRSNALCQ